MLQGVSSYSVGLDELERRFGARVSRALAARIQHANGQTFLKPQPPDAVVWPVTTAEVSEIVCLASQHRIPVIAFGGGTSLEGQINAPEGGISVDFSKMDKVMAVRANDLDCTVEPGVTLGKLRQELRDTGLFFPVDPGSDIASLGGMAATRASGTTTVRYGSMRDNVLNMEAVLANGAIVRTGGRARKSAAGYDLTRLLIGSEGTLGLITELTLKLYGRPEATVLAVAQFKDIAGACQAAISAIQNGLGVARIELLDASQMRYSLQGKSRKLAGLPALFVEFHGSAAATFNDLETFSAITKEHGLMVFHSAFDDVERRTLWQARHDAFWSVKSACPGKEFVVTDIAVPLSRLAETVSETAQDIAESKLNAPIVGHVGDGNFHAIVAFDPSDAGEAHRVRAFLDRLVARSLAMGGTATGEHGVGQGKQRFMRDEHGTGLDVMRAIKAALDPLNILNPSKVF